jgi:predicted amidohydrolase
MKLLVVQSELIWENPSQNKHYIERLLAPYSGIDLIVLPEMFTTGFTMKPKAVAETMGGGSVAWMRELAQQKQSSVAGSIVIEENGQYYNRLVFAMPDGWIQTYDKRHLFTLAGENKVYKSGREKKIINYKGWKICPLICYDLRFPVFARNAEDYDLLLFVANWPKPRIVAWDVLLRARAIENMCFVAGVNRIGSDPNGHEYVGRSQVVDYLGAYVLPPFEGEGCHIVELDRQAMVDARRKFAFLNDRDDFTVM